MRLIVLSLSTVIVLTGCTAILGDENDAATCEKLSEVVSATNVSLGSLKPQAIAKTLRNEIAPLAGEVLGPRIDDLATALEGQEIDAAAASAAASEIGLRCALKGVNFDFTVVGELLK
jgi:outer membrane lipoprotein SlyB